MNKPVKKERRDRIAETYRQLVVEYMEAKWTGNIAKQGILIQGVCMFKRALEMADPDGKWGYRCRKIWHECEEQNNDVQ